MARLMTTVKAFVRGVPSSVSARTRITSYAGLLALLLIAACSSNDAPSPDQPAPDQTATPGAPAESDYTAAPSPLITPPGADKPQGSGSAADLPPILASIAADRPSLIAMTVRDPLPVQAAFLIDPQGQRISALRIDHDRLAYSGRGSGWPQIGVGVMGGSSSGVSTGIGIGFPLLPQQTEAAGSINESHFGFTIPDIAAYNASWQHWKIHIDLSDGVNSRSFETLPPAPPRT